MGKTDYPNGGFVACIPHQIEANWDGEWAPRLAGFPLNIVYTFVQKSKVDENEILRALTACYEPDLDTFSETKKTREMTYFNREGGAYRVHVVLNKASGLLETFKYRGKKLLAYASGLDFDNAMLHTTLTGIKKDEPVRAPLRASPCYPTNLPMPEFGGVGAENRGRAHTGGGIALPGQLVALMLTVIGLSVALVVISTGKPTGTLPWPDVDERGRRGTKAQTIRKGSKALLAAARPLAWVKRRICRGISSSAIVGARRPKNPKK